MKPLLIAGLGLLAALLVCAWLACGQTGQWLALAALAPAIGMGFLMKDAQVKNTLALPSAELTTVDGAAIDLKHGTFGDHLADCEVKLTAPAVTTTMAPDDTTFTYSLIHSVNADLSSAAVVYSALITQTGAGGAGAATANVTVRLPVDVRRYIGVRIVSSADATDASTVAATLEALF